MSAIKIFLIDESEPYRKLLERGLSGYNNINIISISGSYLTSKAKLQLYRPDVIVCDVNAGGRQALGFVKDVMKTEPRRILVLSPSDRVKQELMEAGAAVFMLRPGDVAECDNDRFFRNLAARIAALAQMPVNLIRPGRPGPASVYREHEGMTAARNASEHAYEAAEQLRKQLGSGQLSPGSGTGGAGNITTGTVRRADVPQPRPERLSGAMAAAVQVMDESREKNLNVTSAPKSSKNVLIAMGASTGGTEALLEVLRDLPANTPGIVLVQHMPPNFTKMFASRLDSLCHMSVSEASNGDRVRQGHVLVAPGDLQMQVIKDPQGYSVRCVPGDKVSGHRPSVDVLFESVSQTACPDAIGVILTGMGGDGAKGMLRMRENGAYTIGQDKDTCVVYGMPMVAYNLGAVSKQLPLKQIPAEIIAQLGRM